MYKFLWDVLGVFWIVAFFFCMALCFADQSIVSCVFLIALSIVGYFYSQKRPTWVR